MMNQSAKAATSADTLSDGRKAHESGYEYSF